MSNSTTKSSSTTKSGYGKEDKGVTKKSVGSNFTMSLLKREKRMGEKEVGKDGLGVRVGQAPIHLVMKSRTWSLPEERVERKREIEDGGSK